jgi:type IV pilus assembly protein PilB
MKARIGELMVKYGIITEEQLEEALRLQKKKTKKKLGEILISLEYLTFKDLIWILSEQADIPFVEIRPEMLDRDLINIYPESVLYENCLLPLYETDDEIYIALGDPTNEKAVQTIKKYTSKKVITSGADPQKIEQVLNKFFLSEQLDISTESIYQLKNTTKIMIHDAWVEMIGEDGKVNRIRGSIEITMHKTEEKGDT